MFDQIQHGADEVGQDCKVITARKEKRAGMSDKTRTSFGERAQR